MSFFVNNANRDNVSINGIEVGMAAVNNAQVYKRFGDHFITPEGSPFSNYQFGFYSLSPVYGLVVPQFGSGGTLLTTLICDTGNNNLRADIAIRAPYKGIKVTLESGTVVTVKFGQSNASAELCTLLRNVGVPFPVEIETYL